METPSNKKNLEKSKDANLLKDRPGSIKLPSLSCNPMMIVASALLDPKALELRSLDRRKPSSASIICPRKLESLKSPEGSRRASSIVDFFLEGKTISSEK
jgi:hypothetical protein